MDDSGDAYEFDFEEEVEDTERLAGDFLPFESENVDVGPSSSAPGGGGLGHGPGGAPSTYDDFAPLPLPDGHDPSARFDFKSKYFNSSVVLTTKPSPDPPRKVRPLENVRRFRRLLPPNDPLRIDPNLLPAGGRVQGRKKTPEPTEKEKETLAAKALAMDRAMKFRAQSEAARMRVPVLQTLAETEKSNGGPVANVLTKAMEQKIKVKITTRHASGVRGTAVAYLKAFDRHMNMILVDVFETSSVRTKVWRTVEVNYFDEDSQSQKTKTKTRQGYKLEQKTRHLQQVFLRGEQVVLVALVEGGMR